MLFFFCQNITNMNFQSVIENKRILLAEASDGETKKLVDNSANGSTKKSTKYASTCVRLAKLFGGFCVLEERMQIGRPCKFFQGL